MIATHPLPAVDIARAGPEAAAACARLHAVLFADAWDRPSIAALIAHPAVMAFLAVGPTPDQTLGFILGQVAADEAEVLTLGVEPDWQRCGIATRLIAALAEAARAAGARNLLLDVDAGNTAALALYHKLGFAERGRRTAYYVHAGGAADAVTLARPLV